MAQVAITIAGRTYRVACDEGEEDHLGELAKLVDGKIAVMRAKFGEMGDQRLTVMAAMTLADELCDSNRRVGELEAELAQIKVGAVGAQEQWIERAAAAVGEAAARIERAAQDLCAPPPGA